MVRIDTTSCLFALVACSGVIGEPGSDDPPGVSERSDGGDPEPSSSDRASMLPSASQLRLLNGREYRATVRDLLGIDASPSIEMQDSGNGYDSGSNSRLDENLFGLLLAEAERLGQAYVASRLSQDYQCYDRTSVSEGCVREIASTLGRRAYRRPLTTEETDRLVAMHQRILVETGDAELATEHLITRLLASVHFLYRTELGLLGDADDERELDSYERATLIAYAITGTMPDESLLSAAETHELDEQGMRRHMRRLFATVAGRETIRRFIRLWLRADSLEEMADHSESFPKLDSAEQGEALLAELDAYVDATLEGEGSLRALLTGEQTFVNRHTAPLYGASRADDALTPLQLDGARRRGVLSLASVNASMSSVGQADKDRPIIRGLMIKNRFFCEEIGLPAGIDTAAAVMMADLDNDDFETLTIREQFEAIMNQSPQCIACHQQFMPLGFLFGNFDALGRHVTERNDRPIDTRVESIQIAGEERSYDDHLDLIDDLVNDVRVAHCFTRNVAAFVSGRADIDEADAAVQRIAADAATPIVSVFEDVLVSPLLLNRAGRP